MVGSENLDRSRAFYDALFTAVGGKPAVTDEKGRLIYMHDGAVFMVTRPIDGEPACHANGGTIGFAMASPDQADAWHAAGVAAAAGVGTAAVAAATATLGLSILTAHRARPVGSWRGGERQ